MQVLIKPLLRKGSLNLCTILFAYSLGVQKSSFRFCSPNGLRVTNIRYDAVDVNKIVAVFCK